MRINRGFLGWGVRIAHVPAVLLASLFGWHAREFFAAEPGDIVNPDTNLRTV